MRITVAIPDVTAQSEIIEDCSDDKNSKNPKITWSETGWDNPLPKEKLISTTAELRRRQYRRSMV